MKIMNKIAKALLFVTASIIFLIAASYIMKYVIPAAVGMGLDFVGFLADSILGLLVRPRS